MNKLNLTVFLLCLVSASAIYAQSPREQLNQMVQQLQKNPGDDQLREKIIKLAISMKPAPIIPPEAEKYEGRAQYVFTNAKSETDYIESVQQYLKALEAAPWAANYYYNLCIILEKANRPSAAVRACKFYLAAAPQAGDASDVRKRVAGLEYAVERVQKNHAERSGCESGLYEHGAKLATVYGRRISLSLSSELLNGVIQNKISIFDFTEPNNVFGRRFEITDTDKNIQLDDRVESSPYYRLTLSGSGNITFGSFGSIQAEINTTISELQQLRVEAMKRNHVLVKHRGITRDSAEYYATFCQGGVEVSKKDGAKIAGILLFPSDCLGNLSGEKPGWMPVVHLSPNWDIVSQNGYRLVTPSACMIYHDIDWLSN